MWFLVRVLKGAEGTRVLPLKVATRRCAKTPPPAAGQRGMALAILLWFIAALSILVSGLVVEAKVQSRTAKVQMSMAKMAAVGDGAALLYIESKAAQSASVQDEEGSSLQGTFRIGDTQVWVRAVPNNGLVNLLKAPEDVLFKLFRHGASLTAARAQRLTASVLKWRTEKLANREMLRASDSFSRVQVIEDVMSADGLTRDVFERIRYLCYASMAGDGEVDIAVAPSEVLRVLAGGSASLYQEFIESRRLQQGMSLGNNVRVDSRASINGRAYQRSVWIKSSRMEGVGWNAYRKFPVRGVGGVEFDG